MGKSLLDKAIEVAKENLREHYGAFQPVALFISGTRIKYVNLFRDYQELYKIGILLAHTSCNVILITDSYMKYVEPENVKYVEKNWDTEKPSLYPESMRKESLILMRITFDKAGGYKCLMWVYPYKKVDKKIVFEPKIIENDPKELGGAFIEALIQGYKSVRGGSASQDGS